MSHDCDADFDPKEKKVKRIERVHSVDFVTRPATTRGIHESQEPKMDETEKLKEQLAEANKRAADLEAKANADAEKAAILETAALVESESKSLLEPVREQLREDLQGRAAKPDEVKTAVAVRRSSSKRLRSPQASCSATASVVVSSRPRARLTRSSSANRSLVCAADRPCSPRRSANQKHKEQRTWFRNGQLSASFLQYRDRAVHRMPRPRSLRAIQ